MLQDLRHSFQVLLKRPGFTVVVVATLALGIGMNAAIFSVFNIMLRPKEVKEPESIVRLTFESTRREDSFSYPDYAYFRDNNQSFSDVLAVFEEESFLLGENRPNSDPEEILGNFVSENYFAMLGGSTHLGRSFTADENSVPGRDAVVVLSHRFWQRRFGSDAQLVGRSIKLNGKPFTVIGITHPEFVGLRNEMPEIWLPLAMRGAMATDRFGGIRPEKREWYDGRDFAWLSIYARLKPGRTTAEARTDMNVLWGQVHPESNSSSKRTIAVNGINELNLPTEAWVFIAMVLGASGLVLLIACFNIANMQLARAISRQKEIAVRLCLGASRWRLMRQLVTESFLLAVMGGIAGVLLAWWSLNLFLAMTLTSYGGGEMARLAIDLTPDWRVLTFSFALALLSGVAFGLVPPLRATRPDLIGVVKSEGATATAGATRSRMSGILVIAQVTACFVLLIPAGLLLRSVQIILATDPGYDAKKLLSVGYSLELSGYDAERAKVFQQQLMARLAAMPGVQSVSLNREFNRRGIITLLDQGGTASTQYPSVPMQGIPSTYLDTIGTPLVVKQGMKLVLIGLVIGIPASLAVAQLLSSMLVGLTTTDVLTIAVVSTLLTGVTLIACYLPARRATRVDPLETLRYE